MTTKMTMISTVVTELGTPPLLRPLPLPLPLPLPPLPLPPPLRRGVPAGLAAITTVPPRHSIPGHGGHPAPRGHDSQASVGAQLLVTVRRAIPPPWFRSYYSW